MTNDMDGMKVVVIGGGWSGIAAAWYARQAGADVEIVDDQPSLGGRSRSVTMGDRTVTLGGKNIGRRYTRFRHFIDDHHGGDWEHFGISTSRIENGKVKTIEGNRRGRAAMSILRHAKLSDAARLLRYGRAVQRNADNRFLDGPAFIEVTKTTDPTMDKAFSRYVTDHLIRPMTVRMNGAEPDEAYLGNLGTNLALVLDSFDQLTAGFEPALNAFSRTIAVRQEEAVTKIDMDAAGTWTVTAVRQDGSPHEIQGDKVVLAIPAGAAAALLAPIAPTAVQLLQGVPYNPVGVVVAEYPQPVFDVTGRALMFPAGHVISNAGAYGKDDRNIVRYTLSGRAARPVLENDPSEDELLALGERELAGAMDTAIPPASAVVSGTWRQGLCAYGPHHHRQMEKIRASLKGVQGLALAGDYVCGASIEACFRSGERAADALLDELVLDGAS
ncbi:FAD-dependent oxidoreductase [Microbacterium lacticum]